MNILFSTLMAAVLVMFTHIDSAEAVVANYNGYSYSSHQGSLGTSTNRPTDCLKDCRETYDEEKEACSIGPIAERGECLKDAFEKWGDCKKGCYPSVDKPSKPIKPNPEAVCKKECNKVRAQVKKKCVANGGSNGRCNKVARRAYVNCMKGCKNKQNKQMQLNFNGARF